MPSNARQEPAHERAVDGLAVYGECRDSNISFGTVTVGMDHCVQTESTTVRKTDIFQSVADTSITTYLFMLLS